MDASQAKAIARFLATTHRRPENIVFIGRRGNSFSGNVKHLYLHFLEKHPRCKSVFVTENARLYGELHARGLPAALFPHNEAIEALATASVAVADDFYFRERDIHIFATGAKIVQLWHGVGFKKIGFVEIASSIAIPEERKAHLRKMYSGYDAVLSTSPFYTENLFKTSFGSREIWEAGYPRNDVLLRKPMENDLIGCDMDAYRQMVSMRKKCKICLYAPTFRDDHSDPFVHGALRFDTLSAFLQEKNMFLFLKMHPLSSAYGLENLENIRMISNESDIYPLLPLFDCLITDYSSIYMDYLQLLRPVIFFPYDMQDYNARLREFQFDYNDMTPGPKCFDQDELLLALGAVASGDDGYRKQRLRLRDLAFSHHDARACERTAEHVVRLAGLDQPRSAG
jgi:CDP-glycerol glycerophosphotransferase